jgi:hypothetical protein
MRYIRPNITQAELGEWQKAEIVIIFDCNRDKL